MGAGANVRQGGISLRPEPGDCARRPPYSYPRAMLMIAWTSVATRADADRLAADAVEHNLAGCRA